MAKVLIGNFKGPQGEQGVKGDPGTAATIQVGTTQTVQPEENAEVTNSGTANAAVLNFKIPRGKDGMTDLTAEYKDDSSYTCQPTVNAPVVVKELDGKTEQVETEGNQLFDIGVYNLAASRCNITQDGDYIIFKATDADAYFGDAVLQGQVRSQGTIPVSPNTEYTVTISNSYFTKNYISFLDSNKRGIQDYLNFTSQSQSFTTPDNCAYILLRFGKENSANGDTETFQIMLNKGSTALPWEPYTGGVASPSPDWEQPIYGTGSSGYFDGLLQGGYYNTSGAYTSASNYVCTVNKIPCKATDSVKVELESSATSIIVSFYQASGAFISQQTGTGTSMTATAPTNAGYFMVSINQTGITTATAGHICVTINGEYATGVETTGKNLCPPVSEWIYNSLQNRYETKIFLKGGKKYYASSNIPEPSGNQFVYYFLNTGNAVSKNYTETYTPQKDEYIDMYAYMGRAYSEDALKGTYYIQVEEGESPTDYQPYHHTTLTIPLTSPLYSGDKICYVKPGESYVDADGDTVVADRILYGCYRENATVVFDGSEGGWARYENGALGGYSFYITIPDCKPGRNSSFCNNFTNVVSVWDKEEYGIYGDHGTLPNKYFRQPNETVETLEQWKTWLSENPTEVVYKLAQPYFEPFVDQSIFYSLRTDDTLTYIYSNDPIEPNVTVEVAKNSTGGYLLESYAQAQKNAIAEANSQSRISAIEQQLVNQATTPTE